MPTLEALVTAAAPSGPRSLELGTLAQLLFFSGGVTKRKVYPGGETIHFRAAASTGALYAVEVYLVAGPGLGLEAGVYHFAPGDFALRRLAAGDHRETLAAAAGDPARVRAAPATAILTAIYWRNTWKYRARAYRHFFWDAGTLLANLLATAVALDVPVRICLGFADSRVNALLGLDAGREGSLALVPMGEGAITPGPPPPIGVAIPAPPLSSREVDYPLVRAAYEAAALPDGAAALAWVGSPPSRVRADERPSRGLLPSRTLGETILRRGSTRRFARRPIRDEELSTMLDAAARSLPLDVEDESPPLVELYLLLHAVAGRPSGAYVYERGPGRLRLLRAGDFRREGGYLCLEQSLGADAAVVVFFLANLASVLGRYGHRGYRAVNLAAGLLGGRIYLAAYAVGLGASGLTFYDDEVVRFFAPEAAGLDAIFVTAVGHPAPPEPPSGLLQLAGRVEPCLPGEAGGGDR
jgi:SagB-type dehydrogenase family enzyme